MGKTLGVNGPLSPSPQVACLYLPYRMARSLLWPFASYSLNPHSAAVCTGEVTRPCPAFVGLTSHLWIQNRQITQRPRVLGAVGEQVTRSRVGRKACLPSAEGTSPAKRQAGAAGHGGSRRVTAGRAPALTARGRLWRLRSWVPCPATH